jgi:hypothetical protein
MRLQQIVQPGGPGSFFKSDLQLTAQPVEKSRMTFAFVSITHSITSFPASFLTAIEMLSLCNAHPDIFSASHKRVFLSGGFEASTQTLLHKGRPFILRRITGNWENSNGRLPRYTSKRFVFERVYGRGRRNQHTLTL